MWPYLVVPELAGVQVDHVGANVVEERLVVRDHQQSLLPVLQEIKSRTS